MKYIKLFDNHSGYTEYISGDDVAPYTTSGYVFTCSNGNGTYKRVIKTEVTWTNIGVTPPQATINDCGESIVEIGEWNMQQNGGVFE